MKNNNFTITTKKLAEICGVSQGTVDRALNDRRGISSDTRKMILEKAKEYGYIEKKNIKPKLIGIVIFDLYNEYFSELVMKFETECSKYGYSLVVMFTEKDKQREIDCINQLYYMGVCGIILCPVNCGKDFSRFLMSLGKPIITVGNKIEGIGHIGIDDFRAGYDAAEFLARKRKNIIYYSRALLSKNNNFAQKERYYGFRAYCEENTVNFEPVTDIRDIERASLNEKWAVACSSDYYLGEIIAQYPDVYVLGFDNLHSLTKFRREIPSVDGNISKIAELAVKNIENKFCESCVVEHKICLNRE